MAGNWTEIQERPSDKERQLASKSGSKRSEARCEKLRQKALPSLESE